MLIKVNRQELLALQGVLNETEFAKKLNVSRSHIWRLKKGGTAGQEFIAKFKDAYPDLKFEDYFLTT